MIHRVARRSIGYANVAVPHPRLSSPRRRVRTKRAARRDILRMIPAERPERQTAGMLGHLRATPGSFRDEDSAGGASGGAAPRERSKRDGGGEI